MRSLTLANGGIATACLLCLAGFTAPAQLPAGAPGGVTSALTRLFGDARTFTASVEARVLDGAQKETVRMPIAFAALDGKVRMEIDVSQVQSRELSAAQIGQLKEAGMGKIVSVIRPDKKTSYILYPGLKNYATIPMPKDEAAAVGKDLKVEKTALGKETVDGHPCVKHRVSVKDGNQVVLEATTWNATDLKDFPVQIETKDGSTTSILRFRQVRFLKPDAKQFEVPPDYKPAGN